MEYKANQSSSKNNLRTNKLTASLINLGCPKNQVLAEKIIYWLEQNDFSYVSFSELMPYNFVIVNTCGYLKTARMETDLLLEKLQTYHQRNPQANIIFLGCDVTLRADSLEAKYPEFTFLREKDSLAALNHYFKLTHKTNGIYQTISDEQYAYIQIAEGCDHQCSYCLIPTIKGKYSSFPLEGILQQVNNIIQRFSIKEVILIAQDTSSYGKDLQGHQSLIDVAKNLSELKDLKWIRCLYLYPTSRPDFFRELLSVPKVVPYLDLPLQHVSKKILHAMNRPVLTDHFIEKIMALKKDFPSLAVRTTFIVGFPGETEEEFQNLLKSLETYQFDRAGFFAYSAEPHTKAQQLESSISEEVKENRLKMAYETQRMISEKINQKWIHQTLPVLIEKYDPIRKGFTGRTTREAPEIDNSVFIPTTLANPRKLCGQLVPMLIEEADAYRIKGRLLSL
ncbi:MiaB/RimO family radical SAM methylthiotransferase [bacterium]|nr:MiaB/RimO family radical SAM methylthiotransferase [bacterium]